MLGISEFTGNFTTDLVPALFFLTVFEPSTQWERIADKAGSGKDNMKYLLRISIIFIFLV